MTISIIKSFKIIKWKNGKKHRLLEVTLANENACCNARNLIVVIEILKLLECFKTDYNKSNQTALAEEFTSECLQLHVSFIILSNKNAL